jgi:hypothetical protein
MVVMEETTVEESQERELTLIDRCDSCGAGAYVKVTGASGNLFFCGHHYSKIENNAAANEKMKLFAVETIDERPFLTNKNRLKGDL